MKVMTIAAVAAWGLVAAAAQAQTTTGSFGNWTVVCDNVLTCSAIGFGQLDEMGSSGLLEIRREGEASSRPMARIVTAGETAANLSLVVDKVAMPTLAALPATPEGEEDPEMRITDLSAEQTEVLIGQIVNGAALTVIEGRVPALEVSLSGSSAALRFMDAQQQRAGTTSALVAKGTKAADAIVAPEMPTLRPGPRITQGGLPDAVTPALRPQLGGCDEDIAEIGLEPVVARLAKDKLFWGVACSRGAYNVVYRLFISDEAGGTPTPLVLPYPDGESSSEVMNISFDPETQTLSNFEKGRGFGDCGALNEWVWTGSRFAIKAQTLMPECQGVLPQFWPVSYRSR